MIDQEELIRALMAERIKMLGYIQSLIHRHDLAEDVFQDVCAASIKKRAFIKDEAHLRRWLRMAARRQVLNVLRKRQEQHVRLDDDVMDLLEPVWEQYDDRDGALRAEALRECMATLSKPHQDLIHRRFVENHDCGRIASEIQRSVNSLYVTFSRIYSMLGKCISARLHARTGGGLA